MKKIIFGIFAHPDDEAFGPSATLMKEVDAGAELHLILITDGQAGMNVDNHPDLGSVRLNEWQNAAKLMGATSTHALHYQDGELCHKLYPEIDEKIRPIILEIATASDEPAELSFVTFEQNGITGHLDHIAISFITTHLFCTLKKNLPENVQLKELAYYCLALDQAPDKKWSTYYTPIARDADYINRTVNVRSLLPRKYEVMAAHQTQRHDAENLISLGDEVMAHDCFHVVTSSTDQES